MRSSDFVAPKETGLADYVGAFAVTAGLGIEEQGRGVQGRPSTTTSAILLESLADRLAEAFAERLHERVRTRALGLRARRAPRRRRADRARSTTASGPAPGYPACPEHTEKETLWQLLDVEERTGIELTESMAMWPGASVSGWYFSHPQSQYFVVGRLGRDQVEEYAERKGWDLRTAERWLGPNLGYQPED